MLFEWDEAKSRRTLSERGFGFDYATRIFSGLRRSRTIGETSAKLGCKRSGKPTTTYCSLSTPIAATCVTLYLRGSPAGRNG
jgi:hypothetical protein